jgi:hypothetical protein
MNLLYIMLRVFHTHGVSRGWAFFSSSCAKFLQSLYHVAHETNILLLSTKTGPRMHRTHLQITRHIRHHIPNWRQKMNKYHTWKWARLRLCAQFFLKLSTPTYFSLPLRTSLAFFPISFYSLMKYSTHNTHFLSCTRRRPTIEFCVWFSSI